MNQTSFDGQEQSQITQFDFEAIDRELERENVTAEDLQAAYRALSRLLEWVWQDGPKNMNGFEIRTVIVCWVFLNHLRPLTLTDISRHFANRDKQSLGRWTTDFAQNFPEVARINPHMKPNEKRHN